MCWGRSESSPEAGGLSPSRLTAGQGGTEQMARDKMGSE